MDLRLFARAPFTRTSPFESGRRAVGVAMVSSCRRYFPVSEPLAFDSSAVGVP